MTFFWQNPIRSLFGNPAGYGCHPSLDASLDEEKRLRRELLSVERRMDYASSGTMQWRRLQSQQGRFRDELRRQLAATEAIAEVLGCDLERPV